MHYCRSNFHISLSALKKSCAQLFHSTGPLFRCDSNQGSVLHTYVYVSYRTQLEGGEGGTAYPNHLPRFEMAASTTNPPLPACACSSHPRLITIRMGQFIWSGARLRRWLLFLSPLALALAEAWAVMGGAKAPVRMLREIIFIVPRSARMMWSF